METKKYLIYIGTLALFIMMLGSVSATCGTSATRYYCRYGNVQAWTASGGWGSIIERCTAPEECHQLPGSAETTCLPGFCPDFQCTYDGAECKNPIEPINTPCKDTEGYFCDGDYLKFRLATCELRSDVYCYNCHIQNGVGYCDTKLHPNMRCIYDTPDGRICDFIANADCPAGTIFQWETQGSQIDIQRCASYLNNNMFCYDSGSNACTSSCSTSNVVYPSMLDCEKAKLHGGETAYFNDADCLAKGGTVAQKTKDCSWLESIFGCKGETEKTCRIPHTPAMAIILIVAGLIMLGFGILKDSLPGIIAGIFITIFDIIWLILAGKGIL